MTTRAETVPTHGASSAAENLRRGHGPSDSHDCCAPANTLSAGQHAPDTQRQGARANNLAGGQAGNDSQENFASGNTLGGDHGQSAPQRPTVAAELLFCAEYLDDVEKVRIATENRLRSMAEAGIDAGPYEQQAEAFRKIEHEATLALQRVMRRHPLGEWVKQTKGVGEKQGARLIAAIGHVCWNHLDDRPRHGPAELWCYCGYAPGQKRKKGVKSNWNAKAKMRAFLIAESCIKQRESPYREVYDKARASWLDRDVKDGHKHNHALRLVAKQVLKDLFLEARELGA